MPVGAVIGAGVLTAGATVATGAMASHAQSQSADQAANIQETVANENNQLARDMYTANASRLDPYSSMGLAAGDEYLGLLLGHAPSSGSTAGNGWAPVTGTSHPTPTAGTGTAAPDGYTGPSLSSIMAMGHDGTSHNGQSAIGSYLDYYLQHPELDPGFSDTLMFTNDNFAGDTALAGQVLQARQNYTNAHPSSALAPFGAAAPSSGSALSPVVAQQAQAAIAAGADPNAVRARAAQYGVSLA